MRFCANKCVSTMVLAAFLVAQSHLAYAQGTLRPQDFNKMYYLATQGKVGILREAVHRGLNIDSVNPNGDTGLCIAVKRKNYTAYNSFRMSGANPRHACTYRMYKEYQKFLADEKAANVNKVVGNKESLYYQGNDIDWWPWILGGAAVGGGVWALTHKKGGGHKAPIISGGGDSGGGDEFEKLGYGLAGYVTKYTTKVSGGSVRNTKTIDASNPNAEKTVDNIKFLPNMLSNAEYLNIYAKVMENSSYQNAERQADGSGGVLNLGDAAIALASHGDNAKIENLGNINITAKNGSIAMVASNGSKAFNSSEDIGVSPDNSSDGSINIIFKGNKEGDAVIGMYADTHSSVTNYGKISGIASLPATSGNQENDGNPLLFVDDDNMDDEGKEKEVAANSGTILGMSLFDYYTGTDVSQNTVTATNHGNIKLQAGHNNASNVSISLIGMGSYLDDRFLNGTSNPFFAEKMILFNDGVIDLAYQKTYNLASEALKLGNGGLIGMRADASTGALNKGKINIDMQATTITHDSDVAAGMLSVHGASLVNGTTGAVYDGTNATGGEISMINEATSGGVFYGMLAAKGSGTQTNIYKWKPPSMYNYGLIDMRVSNSYAMASFAGGEIINDGVINLGQENGQSYYKNNRGLYAAGEDITEEVSLINRGIINVYSEESAAIENAFSGSVSLANEGEIYISNKATNSKAFAGNYSTATNYNDIFYKVGNSESFAFPEGSASDIGFNIKTLPIASVITSSTVPESEEKSATKQYVDNETNAKIVLGEVRTNGVDYGGTFGTAGIQVSQQGSADNKGLISLIGFDEDIAQFNTGMWLTPQTTAEAYIDNYGTIEVYAKNSIGLRNDSGRDDEKYGNASATNYGIVNIGSVRYNEDTGKYEVTDGGVSGAWGYGMAATQIGANIFNGRYRAEDRNAVLNIGGMNSIAMYVKNGNAYNYGTINLLGNRTTAFQLDGKTAFLRNVGDVNFTYGLKDIVWYWTTNKASVTLSTVAEDNSIVVPSVIDGFTLGKATTDEEGGFAYLSKTSSVIVQKEDSHLFIAEGEGSTVYNHGNVTVKDGATAIKVSEGATAYHSGKYAIMTVKDNSSVGMKAIDANSTVEAVSGSQVNVEGGIGLSAENLASAVNGGNLNVTGGVGMLVMDGNTKNWSKGENTGSVLVTGNGVIGVKAEGGAQFTNSGEIKASTSTATADINRYAIGVYSNSKVYNTGTDAVINVGNNAVGVYGGTVYNRGNAQILVNGANSYGIYGAEVENGSSIKVSSGAIGIYGGSLDNTGKIEVNGGIGVQDSIATNSGTIEVNNSGIGVQGDITNVGDVVVYSGYGIIGGGSNTGTISNLSGDAGVKVTGSFVNNGRIEGNGSSVLVDGGAFTNKKNVTVSAGTAVNVLRGGASNMGTIGVNNGTGMHIASGAYGVNEASGVINLSGAGYGAIVDSGGSFTNNGIINYDRKKGGECISGLYNGSGQCIDASAETPGPSSVSSPLLLGSGATFINNGSVNFEDVELDFSEGNYVLGKDGTYQATSFKGDILASQDIVKEGFSDTYSTDNAFTGENKGLTATSESYLFDAEVEDKGETSDIKLTRKSFNDLVEEQDLANFFETNYQQQHNEKMYQSLKSAANQAELNEIVESESGKKFYANLPRENMAVLRGIEHGEQKRILEDGLNGATIGANYFRTGKDGNGGLSDYADNVYSATLGYGGHLNRNWSMGGALTAAYADAKYDDIHSKRHNTIVMAFMPILYQNSRFKYLAMPSVGVGYGEYERHANSGNYKADTFDIYYGLYNHAEYSIDMKVAELVAEAELNLQGVNSDTAKEKGGLNLESNDSVSLEAGVGLKLRKRIQLAKQRELMLAVGTKYYHEMLDPYKSLTVGMAGSPVNYKLKGYDEDKNRLRTAAEAMYKDGHFAVSAEIAHNAEKESNVEGGLGVRYNF